tara:strand:- start:1464 stop:1928 length:465 start_codon:yes stop_codon:yes gene_type:complete
MARFDYLCKNCEIVWEREYSIGEAPKRTKCPKKCGKYGKRYYGNQTLYVNWGADTDFQTVRSRNAKYAKDGMSKDEADKFLNDSIARSDKHTKQGWQNYAYYEPDGPALEKMGLAKRRTKEEATKAVEYQKKLTQEVYDSVGRDPSKLDFDKPQ